SRSRTVAGKRRARSDERTYHSSRAFLDRAQQDLHQQPTRDAVTLARPAALSRRHSWSGRAADAFQSRDASRDTGCVRGQRVIARERIQYLEMRLGIEKRL